MVRTTTKTLRYSISKGQNVNSVNATIINSGGCNPFYFGKLSGVLKILELCLASIAVGMVGSLKVATWLGVTFDTPSRNYFTPERNATLFGESFMHGEMSFTCAHSAIIVTLVVLFFTYVFDTVSSMIIPKVSMIEVTANLVLGLLSIAAGITEIVFTELTEWDYYTFPWVEGADNILRFTAGALALMNGILFFVSFWVAKKELAGPIESRSRNHS